MRASGVLLPVASLPSPYGIGGFSKAAYEFVDFLEEAGQKYWQILPLGPTGYGDSPYQSFSTFAGNPYFIDLDTLKEEGFLTEAECKAYDGGKDDRRINYEKIYQTRFEILRIAFQRSQIEKDPEFQGFLEKEKHWLLDYSLYMAVKGHFDSVSWSEWDLDIRLREPKAMADYQERFKEEILFYEFLQFKFQEQWRKLKGYANEKGIKIIGDIPIYVAFDSADTWANPSLFQLDEKNMPIAVSGCPPDGFSATGQLWGNPLYDWEYHKNTSFEWWVQRIAYCFQLYDTVRVDHFRGFDEYYSIPAGAKTAEHGEWRKGPGIEIFQEFYKRLGHLDIIAEDLGFLTPSVLELVKETGYPGMKVLEFAFDSREESDYLPHNYNHNCVVYTGTHDNQTIQAWYEEDLQGEDKKLAKDYMNLYPIEEDQIYWEFVRLALSSVADLAVIPIQDYLGLGHEARINLPSTLGGNNWCWRMKSEELTAGLTKEIRRMTKLYGR